jgi:hypothetical protein
MNIQRYATELRTQASQVLEAFPDLTCTWHDGALRIAASGGDGFEVELQPDSAGIIAFTGVGFHEHCESPASEAVQNALGMARDFLSPDMRIRELLSAARAYRWHLERRVEGGWATESQSGLLLWNYFGRRSERVYQNRHLPGRLIHGIDDRND